MAGTEERSRRALRWWLAAGTFVVGLVVGGIVVGVVAGGSTPLPASGATTDSAAPPSGAAPTARSGPAASGATAEVVVNQACLRAVNAAQDVYGDIGDLADAARQLNAARLDQVIRDLEPLQARLRQGLEACSVVTRLPDTGSGVPATTTAGPSS